jgi:outer membrane protein assembly factor BamB
MIGSLFVVIAIRLLSRLDDPPYPLNDVGFRNVLTLIFSFVAVFTAWIWLCFFSGFSRLVRVLVGLATFVVLGVAIATLRIAEVDGSMVPRFVPVWSAVHDRALDRIDDKAAAAEIDLTTTTADDFPQFLGPQRNCWISEPALSRDWQSQPPKLLWKRSIGAGWSAFSAVNGYAVTMEQRGDEEWVTCYEISSGDLLWGHATKARHQNPLGGIGPRSTPTIHQGRVYALGATGIMRCLDGASGKLLWQDNLQARFGQTQAEDEQLVFWGRAGSPLIVDNLVVVPGGGPLGKAKNLVAFNAESGALAWHSESPQLTKENQPTGRADQISYSSPALATLAGVRQILIVNESSASGHDPATGKTLWSHFWPGKSNADANGSQAAAVSGIHVLLSKGYSAGAELLQFTTADNGTLRHRIAWKNPRVLQTKLTNVSLIDDHLYGLSEGILECVELDGGKRMWKGGRYGHGQILGVGSLLLVLAEDGRLALVEASPQRFTELAQIQPLEGKTWNNLCLYGRRLLIRNAQEAACYELP